MSLATECESVVFRVEQVESPGKKKRPFHPCLSFTQTQPSTPRLQRDCLSLLAALIRGSKQTAALTGELGGFQALDKAQQKQSRDAGVEICLMGETNTESSD
jgi:hypothetical protein